MRSSWDTMRKTIAKANNAKTSLVKTNLAEPFLSCPKVVPLNRESYHDL